MYIVPFDAGHAMVTVGVGFATELVWVVWLVWLEELELEDVLVVITDEDMRELELTLEELLDVLGRWLDDEELVWLVLVIEDEDELMELELLDELVVVAEDTDEMVEVVALEIELVELETELVVELLELKLLEVPPLRSAVF
jgi:hypothetical protein